MRRAKLNQAKSRLDINYLARPELLWLGCDRNKIDKKQKYHKYPDCLKKTLDEKLRVSHGTWDARSNGPAVVAYLIAGGKRPFRVANKHHWSIHHLYCGKHPYSPEHPPLHATTEGAHFTQSAGLVALHPVAHALCEELWCFSWFLRAKAFKLFLYDPDGAFGKGKSNKFGFINGFEPKIWCGSE